MKYYISKIIPDYKTAKFVYWRRPKYDKRFSLYEIERNNGSIKLLRKEIA